MIEWNSSRMQCSDTVSLQCGSSHVISSLLTDWISCRSVNTCKVSLQCGILSCFQVSWQTESLVAVWTLVRFLSSVNPLVCFQVFWLTESLVAVWTLVRFSPVWILWCRFKCWDVIKVFSHSKHIWSLTPVCVFWCTFKLCRCKKVFPQKGHECGFSFEWTFRCLFKFEALKNVFPHWSHSCSFSPVWILMCILRVDDCVKLFRTDHMRTVSLQCGSSCEHWDYVCLSNSFHTECNEAFLVSSFQ